MINQPPPARPNRDALLPCPFCGSDKLKGGGDDKAVGVCCLTCEATGPNHYGKSDWNSRARPLAPPKPAPIAVREALDAEEKVLLTEYHSGRLNGNRVISAAFERLRSLLSAPVPPADGSTVTRESIAQELVLYERWTILDEATCAMIHRAISFILRSPSATGAVAWECIDERYPYVRGIVTTRAETVEAWCEGDIKFTPLVRPTPPVSGDREAIARALAIAFHGDEVEWRGFLTKAGAFLAALTVQPPQSSSGGEGR